MTSSASITNLNPNLNLNLSSNHTHHSSLSTPAQSSSPTGASPKMCTQAITQSLCSHCKELLLEITTEERCTKVIQAQAYTFSCGTKRTSRAKEYPRKCANCVKREQSGKGMERSGEFFFASGLCHVMFDVYNEWRKDEGLTSFVFAASTYLLSPIVAGRGIRCHSCPSLWQLGGRSR